MDYWPGTDKATHYVLWNPNGDKLFEDRESQMSKMWASIYECACPIHAQQTWRLQTKDMCKMRENIYVKKKHLRDHQYLTDCIHKSGLKCCLCGHVIQTSGLFIMHMLHHKMVNSQPDIKSSMLAVTNPNDGAAHGVFCLRPALPEKPKLLEIIRNDLCSYSGSDIPRVSYFHPQNFSDPAPFICPILGLLIFGWLQWLRAGWEPVK